MTSRTLADALRMIGWSQRELARRAGVDETRVRRWAAGKAPIPPALAAWLAKAAAWHANHPPPVCNAEAKAAAQRERPMD
jgi:transcriptional regulator with XRE-family HTH domain